MDPVEEKPQKPRGFSFTWAALKDSKETALIIKEEGKDSNIVLIFNNATHVSEFTAQAMASAFRVQLVVPSKEAEPSKQ
jgi:type IV secretory pathway VirB9-like protein